MKTAIVTGAAQGLGLVTAQLLARREYRVILLDIQSVDAQVDRLHAAIVAGDETLARHLFARLSRGVPLTDLCERVVAPAMTRIGGQWVAGQLSIATEHRASAICERLIAARAHQPQGRPRGVAVTTTPPGERHGLPALMATVCLREDRWLVHHLAADLPAAEVARMAVEDVPEPLLPSTWLEKK